MTSRPFPARWPALLTLALFAGLFLAGCQANAEIPEATAAATTIGGTITPQESTAPSAAPLSTSTVTPTALPPLELKGQSIEFWHPWQGDLAKRVDEAAAEFNRANEWGISVKVKAFYSTGALEDAASAGLENKENGLPQVIAAPGEQLAEWAEKEGSLVDLSPLISHPQYGLSQEEIAAFDPDFWSQDQAGDRRVGVPALRTARVIFYNESWAKELGFSGPPKTPAEFQTQACAAAQKNNTSGFLEKYGNGGWMIDHDAMTTLSWMGVFGAEPVPGEAGKPYAFASDEAEEALAFLRDMLDKGCAWLPRNPAPYEYFSRRMALFYSGTLPDVYVQARWQEQQKSSDSWKIIPFLSEDGKPVVYSGGYSYAVFQSKPETDMAAWLFVRWLEEPAVAARLIEALPGLPVNSAHAAQFESSRGRFPWNMILPLAEPARPAPSLASWQEVHRLVEDAAWQIYRVPVEELPQLLPELDQAIQDMVTEK